MSDTPNESSSLTVSSSPSLASQPDLSSSQKKRFRQAAHHIDPVVTVGDQGLSDGVLAEAERALTDHELIKVRLAGGDRAERTAQAQALATAAHAQVVQQIGKVVVLYRHNKRAKAHLSNVSRYLGTSAS